MDKQPPQQHIPVTCPTWGSPLLHVVHNALEIRCKSCRGIVHRYTREWIEQQWAIMEQQQQCEEVRQ